MTTRREVALGLAALAAATQAGCAEIGAPPRRQVVVDLAGEGPRPQPPSSGVGGAAALSVVRTSVDPSRRMTAPVTIDGRGPFTFVVDTGANRSVMSLELAASLGFSPGPSAMVHGIAGVEPAATVRVGRLAVGQVSSVRLGMLLLKAQALGADGILGVDVFKDRLVQLDFQNRRLFIGPSRPSPGQLDNQATRVARPGGDETSLTVPARYRFGQLTVVDADAGGLPITAFLDSGSETTVGNLALRDGDARRQPALAAHLQSVQLLSATGQTAMGEIGPLPLLRLGGLKMGNLGAVFSDLHAFEIWGLSGRPAILIGMDILHHFNMVELDFGRRQVRFHIPRESLLA
ncbi:MAG TPA: retropepsin-like aspartic protease [Caulobacteraceae bacterium]